MKLVLGLIFTLMIVFTMPLAFATTITVTTDKSQYYVDDIIIISGNVQPPTMEMAVIEIIVIYPDNQIYNGGLISMNPVTGDFSYSMSYPIKKYQPLVYGIHTIEATVYGKTTATTTFELFRDNLELQTHKQQYNEIETITLTGTINNITPSPTDTITIDILDHDDNNLIPTITNIPITSTNEFSYNLTTDHSNWRYYKGTMQAIATYQTHIASTTFNYSDWPLLLSLESLYTAQQNLITTLQAQIDTLLERIIILETPTPEITICHVVPVIPETITILVLDWPAHEAHGDYLGKCIIVEPPLPEEILYCGLTKSAYDKIQYVNESNDKLIGTSQNDLLIGDERNNFIKGKAGNDCLVGGAGFDILRGGSGIDTCIEGEDVAKNCEFTE